MSVVDQVEVERKVAKLKTIVKKAKGRFFTVIFVKADGTTRKMNCRTGVHKYIDKDKQANKPYVDPMRIGNVAVYEPGIGYRTFKLERVKQIKINGQVIDWDQL